MDTTTAGVALRTSRKGTVSAETFEVVYERNWQPLYRVAWLMVSDRAEAEELVQDAFTNWWCSNNSVENPDAYLRTVLVNLCRGRHRRRATARKHQHLLDGSRSQVGAQDPLLDVVGRLAPRQKAAVVLRFYEGRDDREIAQILRCRPATVRSLLSRAVANMRNEVER